MASAAKQTGTCKRFNATKGFGFITDSESGKDLFVHHSAIFGDGFRTLAEGEQVEYDIQVDDQGRSKAVNVTGPQGSKVMGDQRPRRFGLGDDDAPRDNRGPRTGGYGQQQRSYNSSNGYRRDYQGGDRDYQDSASQQYQGGNGGGARNDYRY